MSDVSVIADVRTAKVWLDAQAPTLAEHVRRIREIEMMYADRTGAYSALPAHRPAGAQEQIEAAASAPGRDLLRETRTPRTA